MNTTKPSAIAITAAALSWAHPASPETVCTFTTECFETDGCADTSFTLTYQVSTCPIAPGPRGITVETDFGDLQGKEIGSVCAGDDISHGGHGFYLSGQGATFLLSVTEGNARLTTHIEGPITISYFGICEARE